MKNTQRIFVAGTNSDCAHCWSAGEHLGLEHLVSCAGYSLHLGNLGGHVVGRWHVP
jgi:hypothetical protein